MSSAHSSEISTISVAAARQIDAACDRWEKAWLAGRPDRSQDYLSNCEEALRPVLLRQLLLLEWEYRHQLGESVNLAKYINVFPEYSTLIQDLIAEHAVAMATSAGPAEGLASSPPRCPAAHERSS
jgi:serine/threonine-protein kinase